MQTNFGGPRPSPNPALTIDPAIISFIEKWRARTSTLPQGLTVLFQEGRTVLNPGQTTLLARPHPWERAIECGLASLGICLDARHEQFAHVRRILFSLPFVKVSGENTITRGFYHALTSLTDARENEVFIDFGTIGELMGFKDGVGHPKLFPDFVRETHKEIAFASLERRLSVGATGINLSGNRGPLITKIDLGHASHIPLEDSSPLLNVSKGPRGEIFFVTAGILAPSSDPSTVNITYNIDGPILFDPKSFSLVALQSFMARTTLTTPQLYNLYEIVKSGNLDQNSLAVWLFGPLGKKTLGHETKFKTLPAKDSPLWHQVETQGAGLFWMIHNLFLPRFVSPQQVIEAFS